MNDTRIIIQVIEGKNLGNEYCTRTRKKKNLPIEILYLINTMFWLDTLKVIIKSVLGMFITILSEHDLVDYRM